MLLLSCKDRSVREETLTVLLLDASVESSCGREGCLLVRLQEIFSGYSKFGTHLLQDPGVTGVS